MKLITGLGNPGARYAKTRHNVGFLVVDALAVLLDIELSERFDGRFGRARLGDVELLLVEPLTFMNLSGLCVGQVVRFFHIEPRDVLVVHDDVDLTLGRVMVKMGGGDGGHKGVRSVIEHLGTSDFARLRLGIGRPQGAEDVTDYVLSPFGPEEEMLIAQGVEKALGAIKEFLVGGVERAQRYANRRERPMKGDIQPSCPGDKDASGPQDRKEVS